jgi:hypothetical protein
MKMNRTQMTNARMNNSEPDPAKIDHILATDEELIPSSGFLASVMERVHDEARAPAPIPFPWKRAVPGIVLTIGVFGFGAFEFIRQGIPAVGSMTLVLPQIPAVAERSLQQAGWVALALAVSLISWLLARRIAGPSES